MTYQWAVCDVMQLDLNILTTPDSFCLLSKISLALLMDFNEKDFEFAGVLKITFIVKVLTA